MGKQTGVAMNVAISGGNVLLLLTAEGLTDIPITVTPQAAFELGEQMGRAAHEARFGQKVPSDMGYLHQQVRERCTEDMRKLLSQRVNVMLNSLREDKKWSNEKLARELVDVVLTRVA